MSQVSSDVKVECEHVGEPVMENFIGRKCKLEKITCWNYANKEAVEKCILRKAAHRGT